ncbi:HAD-IIA family hydrolase [bacterium]|nr:HAD-IIA family hydrolase [bacterium]
METEGIRGWLIDVEGTLVVDKSYRAVPGAVQWLSSLVIHKIPFAILTNNTTLTRSEMGMRLRDAGFGVTDRQIIGCQGRAVQILHEHGSPECWVLGSDSLIRTLEAGGLLCRDLSRETPEENDIPRALVLGWMENPDARLLSRAVELLQRPLVTFVTLHKNRLFRNAGRVEPGLGAWASALEYASGKEAIVAGKPALDLFRAGARALQLRPNEIAMVGDDPQADLTPAAELGRKTVFVLSGKYGDTSVLKRLPLEFRPEFVAGSVAELEKADG